MADLTSAGQEAHPADVVAAMVARVLDLAATWLKWDGTPRTVAVQGEAPRTYTPHKAVRRVADHLLDHLAEIDARLAGLGTEPDEWHGSTVTTPADLTAFTQHDLDEARSRLRRLGQMWDTRLRGLTDQQLDLADPHAWTLREVALHVAGSTFYADAVGDLSAPSR